jgi:hypothetical protein
MAEWAEMNAKRFGWLCGTVSHVLMRPLGAEGTQRSFGR